jgi:excisionase family DNA binding protein
MSTQADNGGYADKKQASHFTSLSVRALDYARQRGELASIKVGRKVIFKFADLDAWMSRFKAKSSVPGATPTQGAPR